MTARLLDKVALITGGGRGIGRAIALAYAQAGASVALAARTAGEVETVGAQIRALGRPALALVADVRAEPSVQAMVERTLEHFGRIDILLNNAGVAPTPRPIFGTALELWDDVLAANLRGPFLCIKHVWRAMVRQRGGVILNIGSVRGPGGAPMLAAYSASKSGLIGLTKSAAAEGRQFNIRVNMLYLGPTDTALLATFRKNLTGIRVMPPDEVTGTAIYLASDDSRYTTGQAILLHDWRPAQIQMERDTEEDADHLLGE